MDYLKIIGGSKLSGSVDIAGAKNAALPLLALCILSKNPVRLSNVPDVSDVKTLLKLLVNLGATYESITDNEIIIDATTINNTVANYDIVRTMRASILTLGPLLARFGHCEVSLPGGCAIGQRPIDLHLKALEQMGADIQIKSGYVVATAPKGLQGATIVFDKVTVTGSENIIMAAALAHGTTTIINVAKEPEVIQLCEVLQSSGIKIEGIGSNEITVEGNGAKLIDTGDITVIPDRIEAGTYLCAGAITNSQITVNNVIPHHLDAVVSKFKSMGFGIEESKDSITILPVPTIKPVEIVTSEYPGFPTDMQAQFMALSCVAQGVSIIEERLFENRFMHVSELIRMGAHITLKSNTATIDGSQTKLSGADVMATDLRASSALILVAIVADGQTNIHRIYHLDRGYDKIEQKLRKLGANITRLQE
jgi:UDP-N-acetylglucosamine 1-carboxyvinyltransferase